MLAMVLLSLTALSLPFGLAANAPEAAAEVRRSQPHLPHGDCRRLTRQIARYAHVADMARERDDSTWEEHTMTHIGRLTERRAKLCPQYAKRPAGEQLLKMLKDAADIAITLFTWGVI
jgi:hypothetical protein